MIQFKHISSGGLSMIKDTISQKNCIMHLLASMSDLHSRLVRAFETSAWIPKMEVVTEGLMHEEKKMPKKIGNSSHGNDDIEDQ